MKEFGYAVCMRDWIFDTNLSEGELRLLLFISMGTAADGHYCGDFSLLADRLGVTSDQIDFWFGELGNKNLVGINDRGIYLKEAI